MENNSLYYATCIRQCDFFREAMLFKWLLWKWILCVLQAYWSYCIATLHVTKAVSKLYCVKTNVAIHDDHVIALPKPITYPWDVREAIKRGVSFYRFVSGKLFHLVNSLISVVGTLHCILVLCRCFVDAFVEGVSSSNCKSIVLCM